MIILHLFPDTQTCTEGNGMCKAVCDAKEAPTGTACCNGDNCCVCQGSLKFWGPQLINITYLT